MHQNQTKSSVDEPLHIPVLLDEVLEMLQPHVGDSYLDLTAGYGGHAAAIIEQTQQAQAAVLVDRDENAIRELSTRFGSEKPPVDIRQQDFLSATQQLADEERRFSMILADLGVSSPHLNQADRGFALQLDGPLDMRMDQSQELNAAKVVNTYKEADLADIIWRYGEEPKARQIARLITGNRPFNSTTQLAAIVAKAWPGHSRVHPATRTFQALRIAVNDELGLLEKALPIWLDLLEPGGRIAIISFHSLEDGIVKRVLHDVSGDRYDAEFRELTKRPITASPQELVSNPRARSAKLRAAVKK